MDIAKMSEEERKDTLMEAKILEKLKHPNIICFREVYKTKKSKLCIVMDYADGGDLAQRIASKKGRSYFKETQILDYFVQICLAMKHIHDRKVLHRDLKSQNIFLTKGNMVKLGDFGIAKMLTNTNQMVKTMVGTPYYLSPEIVEGKKYSFKSDIWSMGILLYEMCTLKPPFDAQNLQSLALKIVNGKYAPIPTMYSKEMKDFVHLLLNRDPQKRPRIHEILNMPIVKNRIKDFLTKTQQNIEFNHTIIHKKDLNQIYVEQQKEQQLSQERLEETRSKDKEEYESSNIINNSYDAESTNDNSVRDSIQSTNSVPRSNVNKSNHINLVNNLSKEKDPKPKLIKIVKSNSTQNTKSNIMNNSNLDIDEVKNLPDINVSLSKKEEKSSKIQEINKVFENIGVKNTSTHCKENDNANANGISVTAKNEIPKKEYKLVSRDIVSRDRDRYKEKDKEKDKEKEKGSYDRDQYNTGLDIRSSEDDVYKLIIQDIKDKKQKDSMLDYNKLNEKPRYKSKITTDRSHLYGQGQVQVNNINLSKLENKSAERRDKLSSRDKDKVNKNLYNINKNSVYNTNVNVPKDSKERPKPNVFNQYRSNYESNPNPAKNNVSNLNKIKEIDEQLEAYNLEKEKKKKEMEEKKKKREDERNRFLNEIKMKNNNKNGDVEIYWSEKNALNTNECNSHTNENSDKKSNTNNIKDTKIKEENFVVENFIVEKKPKIPISDSGKDSNINLDSINNLKPVENVDATIIDSLGLSNEDPTRIVHAFKNEIIIELDESIVQKKVLIESEESEYDTLSPGGIDEEAVNRDDYIGLNECMMQAFMDEGEVDINQIEDSLEDTDSTTESKDKDKEVEVEEDKEDDEELDEDQCDPEYLKKIGVKETDKLKEKDNADVLQFYNFLKERMGPKIDKVKEFILKYNVDEDETEFNTNINQILDEQSKLTYLPLVHALINMEDLVKYHKK